MNLKFDLTAAYGYTSKSQIARVLTEKCVGQNIFCPSCGNEILNEFANNSPVADFYCSVCKSEYELKSKKDSKSLKIVDGAFSTMIKRINSDNNPNFFFLNYNSRDLTVQNFFVIPKYYFIDEIIEKRKPLGSNARRAGWVGCNILLNGIPESGKIHYIKNSQALNRSKILSAWKRTEFLSEQKKESRGWTIELMKILDKIKNDNFTLKDVYQYEKMLQDKFPNNNYVKDKIRQQLQVLRDKGLIEFKVRGNYSKIIDND
jgi:type II restriction enzyme